MKSEIQTAALVILALLVTSRGFAAEISLPITASSEPGSYKSVPESQKGGSSHIGEGLPPVQDLTGSSRMVLDNDPAPLPTKPLQCKLNVLRKLGWTINQTLPANSRPTIDVTSACYAKTVEDLRNGRALKISLPSRLQSSTDIQNANDAVNAALTGEGTMCAYETFVGPAAQTASKKLFTNHLYSFATFLGSGSIRLGNLKQYWTRVPCADDDKCYQPLPAPSYSIEALYTGNFASECATGLQLAEYATIYELFGRKEFDTRFRNPELFVGDWDSITPSASVIHGTTGRRYTSLDGGMGYAKPGPQMFLGVTGYIGNVLGDKFLDTDVDRGENFMIVRISDEATRTFIKNGGLNYYNLAAQRIWKLAQGRSPEELARLADNNQSAAYQDGSTLQLKAMLNDPYLRDTIVYVHDIGFRSLSQHLIRLVKLNPRTPYSIRFYSESIHGEIFDRWIRMQLDNCNN